jgi:mono/diheme cytochrome c family protein
MKNGMPANDERVREIITYGRAKMPSFGRSLTPEQINEVMQYLNTL